MAKEKQPSKKPQLSIVLPVFNEEKNISLIVNKYLTLNKKIPIEVLFVEDGGSKDNTREELQKYAKKYAFVKPVFTSEKGYGISIHNGLKKARAEYVCWTHADMQTDPADTLRALDLIKNAKDP